MGSSDELGLQWSDWRERLTVALGDPLSSDSQLGPQSRVEIPPHTIGYQREVLNGSGDYPRVVRSSGVGYAAA